MSGILLMIPQYGLEAVDIACRIALEEDTVSRSVITNYLTRLTEEPKAADVAVPEELRLLHEPLADCTAYDRLLRSIPCCARAS
jgi:uncharacterized protein YciW